MNNIPSVLSPYHTLPKKSYPVGGRLCSDSIIGIRLPNMGEFLLPQEYWIELQTWIEGSPPTHAPSISSYRIMDEHNNLVAAEWIIAALRGRAGHTVFYATDQKKFKGMRQGQFPATDVTRFYAPSISKIIYH